VGRQCSDFANLLNAARNSGAHCRSALCVGAVDVLDAQALVRASEAAIHNVKAHNVSVEFNLSRNRTHPKQRLEGQRLKVVLDAEAAIDCWFGFKRWLVRGHRDCGPCTLFVSQPRGALGF
jgi:hypothetical protein